MTQPKVDTDKIEAVTRKWDLCDVRYVRWQPAVMWMLGTVGVVISLAYAGGRWGAQLEAQISAVENRCTTIEHMVTTVDSVDANVNQLLKAIQVEE